MRTPAVRDAQWVTESDFTDADWAEFHRLMTELVTTCKEVVEQHAPDGVWAPSSSGIFDQFGESMLVIADISRSLNKARGGMRRISGRARERLYDRAATYRNPYRSLD
ncbi:hypothetical protein [Streptomyces monashensis]|uniref:ESX-1 secretion-associated protein n=1 Tax=Streptomyces monashensis TaxID=1678012 RepID=A0A1S2PKV7_9ACTN|nr:hypothetical protein [Streptomyces monashensis]OIJ93594.1 hypothetical protein BIV23_37205 [Streptomyces monashensis]